MARTVPAYPVRPDDARHGTVRSRSVEARWRRCLPPAGADPEPPGHRPLPHYGRLTAERRGAVPGVRRGGRRPVPNGEHRLQELFRYHGAGEGPPRPPGARPPRRAHAGVRRPDGDGVRGDGGCRRRGRPLLPSLTTGVRRRPRRVHARAPRAPRQRGDGEPRQHRRERARRPALHRLLRGRGRPARERPGVDGPERAAGRSAGPPRIRGRGRAAVGGTGGHPVGAGRGPGGLHPLRQAHPADGRGAPAGPGLGTDDAVRKRGDYFRAKHEPRSWAEPVGSSTGHD